MVQTPKVFVSYSWDSDEHRAWVRELAERLVGNGVDVRLDRWHLAPGDSLTAFMEQQIADCDYVLIICTPNYAHRSTARMGGVGYEQQIISGEIASGIQRRKFIPIVRDGEMRAGPDTAIPPHLLSIYAIDMRSPDGISDELEGLLRAIYRVPALTAPARGPKPSFALTSGSQTAPTRPLRLPSIEFDGWELRSGVAINEQYPETFAIPSADDVAGIVPTDFVKLSFQISTEDADSDNGFVINGERMWVHVAGAYGPYLWGTLANQPLDGEEHGLAHGAEIVFLPEHVIDIVGAEQQAKEEAAFHKRVAEEKVQKRRDRAKEARRLRTQRPKSPPK